MNIYTNRQITKILGELNYLQKKVNTEKFNSIGGEGLSQAVNKILEVILDGEQLQLIVREVKKQ